MEKESEKNIEVYLRDEVKKLGGRAYKFVSPGNNGVPDRLVCLPGGRTYFVELKSTGRKPTALQSAQQGYLTKLGFVVFGCVDSRAKVDAFIAAVRG